MKRLGIICALLLPVVTTGCRFNLVKSYDGERKLTGRMITVGWLYHSERRYDREFRETRFLGPLVTHKRDGKLSLLRIWPLYYHHLDERHLGIARGHEPGAAKADSDIFSLMENSFAGQLSSLAALSILKDDYSSSVGLIHPLLFLFHAEDNREHWPQAEDSQPTGLYSILAPWWYADYFLVGGSFTPRYFPPIAGYDSYAGSLKFLNLYCHSRGFDLHPLLGCSFGKEGYFYLWPIYRVAREGGELQTATFWAAFPNGVWSEPWNERTSAHGAKPKEE